MLDSDLQLKASSSLLYSMVRSEFIPFKYSFSSERVAVVEVQCLFTIDPESIIGAIKAQLLDFKLSKSGLRYFETLKAHSKLASVFYFPKFVRISMIEHSDLV